MALPLILLGAAGAAALFGAKKGVDAYSDNKEAKRLNKGAEETFDTAKYWLQQRRAACSHTLKVLGRSKFDIWDNQLGRFVRLFEQLRNVQLEGAADIAKLGPAAFSRSELARMKQLSGYAREVVGGGAAAIGSGALIGMASYGGAMMFASASTGTAIGTLSGVAATNATLAWFGGGSLAAGGLGMAGGIAVLGGIVAGPVLAVGGAVFAAKARESLATARSNLAMARKAAAEMRAATTVVDGIQKVAKQSLDLTWRLGAQMTIALDGLEELISQRGTNYARFTQPALFATGRVADAPGPG